MAEKLRAHTNKEGWDGEIRFVQNNHAGELHL